MQLAAGWGRNHHLDKRELAAGTRWGRVMGLRLDQIALETPEGFIYCFAVPDDFGNLQRTHLDQIKYYAFSSPHDEQLLKRYQTPVCYLRPWSMGYTYALGLYRGEPVSDTECEFDRVARMSQAPPLGAE